MGCNANHQHCRAHQTQTLQNKPINCAAELGSLQSSISLMVSLSNHALRLMRALGTVHGILALLY
jgi:hypothetical protein